MDLKDKYSRRVLRWTVTTSLTLFCFVNLQPAVARPRARTQQPKATKFKPACPAPSYPSPAPAKSLGIDLKCLLPGFGHRSRGPTEYGEEIVTRIVSLLRRTPFTVKKTLQA